MRMFQCWTCPWRLEGVVGGAWTLLHILRTWSELPSVSLTSVCSTHLRVSGSPPLFVQRWTSLAVCRAVSPATTRGGERKRRGVIHSLCAQSAVEITLGNETADGGGGGWIVSTNTLFFIL